MYLIHDSTFLPEQSGDPGRDGAIHCLGWAAREEVPAGARVLVCLGDEQIRELAPLALEREWEVGVLPHPDARTAMGVTGVQGDLAAIIEHYREASAVDADVLYCNGELVFSSVVIGRVLALRPYDINRPQTTWSVLTGALKGLGGLTVGPYKLTTGKDRSIALAALGLVAVGNAQSSLVGRSFSGGLAINDGRLTLLALAPRSILGYLVFLFRLLLPGKIELSRLPRSLGLVQSSRIHLEAAGGAEYLLDGKPVHASEIELQVLEQRLRLLPGPNMNLRRSEVSAGDKESVRLNDVPVDSAAQALLGHHLPLFKHASEEEYRELFIGLRDNAAASSSYQVLMVLSVLLALTGLYANSAPVIIGAMILAPLMAPIVSLAMGLARTDPGLIRGSLRTLGIGIAWGLSCAVLLAWAMPLDIPTAEMRARMSPTLLDLLVAVISGVAGAYASAKEEIARSLAGVAIAVALVPPLSVVGIGLGWGDWQMAGGALLLLATNLSGIALAGSLTFLVMGFAPFERARKGLGITLVIVLLISVPLYATFRHLVERGRIEERVPATVTLDHMVVGVSDARVSLGDPPLIRLVLSSPERLDDRDLNRVKQAIVRAVEQPIVLEAQMNIRR